MAESPQRIFNILHLIASNFYGGPEKQIVEHLKRLDKKHFKGAVAVYTDDEGENQVLKNAQLAQVENFRIVSNGPLDFTALKNLKSLLQNQKIDLLCTHGFKSIVNGWINAKRLGIPIIAFSRGFTAENRKVAFYEWLDRRFLRKTDGIISVSHGQKVKLETFGIRHPNNFVIHNAVESHKEPKLNTDFKEQFYKEYNLPENAVLAVTAGRLSPEKGHRFLIEAISTLNGSAQNAYFIFCGDGVCMEDLKKQARENNVYDHCRFIGFRKDISDIFDIMHFFVLPSLTEGLPNVVLESFSKGKPVISTAVGGVPELVTDNKNGFLVEAKDSKTMAKRIKDLYESQSLREQFGKEGLNTVRTAFSFDKQNGELQEVYNKIIQNSQLI